MSDRFLYIFLDEAGNLDFSRNGSKYFVLGCITKERPFQAYKELTEFKYDQVERGTALEYFHASENAQAVRNGVFDIIQCLADAFDFGFGLYVLYVHKLCVL